MASERLAILYCTAGSLVLHAALGLYVATAPLPGPAGFAAMEVSLEAGAPEKTAVRLESAGLEPTATPTPPRVTLERQSEPAPHPGVALAASTANPLQPLAPPPPPVPRATVDTELPPLLEEYNHTSPNLASVSVRAAHRSRQPADGISPGDGVENGARQGPPLDDTDAFGDKKGDTRTPRLTMDQGDRGRPAPASSAARLAIVAGRRRKMEIQPVPQPLLAGNPAQLGDPSSQAPAAPQPPVSTSSTTPPLTSFLPPTGDPTNTLKSATGFISPREQRPRDSAATGEEIRPLEPPPDHVLPGAAPKSEPAVVASRQRASLETPAAERLELRFYKPEALSQSSRETVPDVKDAPREGQQAESVQANAPESSATPEKVAGQITPESGPVGEQAPGAPAHAVKRSSVAWASPQSWHVKRQPSLALARGHSREEPDVSGPSRITPQGTTSPQVRRPGLDRVDPRDAREGSRVTATVAARAESRSGPLTAAPTVEANPADVIHNQKEFTHSLARVLKTYYRQALADVQRKADETHLPQPPDTVPREAVPEGPREGTLPDLTAPVPAVALAQVRTLVGEEKAEKSSSDRQAPTASSAAAVPPAGAVASPTPASQPDDSASPVVALSAGPQVVMLEPSLVQTSGNDATSSLPGPTPGPVPVAVAPAVAPVLLPTPQTPPRPERPPVEVTFPAEAPPKSQGVLEGTAVHAGPTLTPGREAPGEEGGERVVPIDRNQRGPALRGERAQAFHSAEIESFLPRCGLDPSTVDPGEILDIDARESEYWPYLMDIRKALSAEFGQHTADETGELRGWVQLMFQIDSRGRVKPRDIWVKRNPGERLRVLTDIALKTVEHADLPKIPNQYHRKRLFLIATFNFGASSDGVTGLNKR